MKKPPIGTRCGSLVSYGRGCLTVCHGKPSKFEKSDWPRHEGRKVWWCHQHAPSTKAALEAARQARWAEERQRRDRRNAWLAKEDRRRAALDRLLPQIVDALDADGDFPNLVRDIRRLLP